MQNLRGFTLIELIVVILILGILAAIAVIGYAQITDRANETATAANAKQVVTDLSAEATLANADSVASWVSGVALTKGTADTADDYADAAAFFADRYDFPVSLTGTDITVDGLGKAADVVIDASSQVAQVK